MGLRLALRLGLFGALILASCGGNVAVEPSGSGAGDAGGDGGEGGGTGGAGTTTGTGVGAGNTGTGGAGGITTTGGVGAGGACPEDIESAVAAAPDPLGFGSEPPPSGTYTVVEVAPEALVILDAAREAFKYRWVGKDLGFYFQVGDTAFVDVDKGLGAYHVIASPAQHYVATYQAKVAGAPMVAGEAPYTQPTPGFSAHCQLAAGPKCRIAWHMNVSDGELVIVPLPIGAGAWAGAFEWQHVSTVSDCDVTSSEVRFTVTGGTDMPE